MNYIVALVTATTCVACLSSPTPLEEETRTDTTSEPTDVVETVEDAEVAGDAEVIGDAEVETIEEAETVETIQDVETEVEVEVEVETIETSDDVETEVVPPGPLELTLESPENADMWVIENERIKMVLEERSGWLPAQLAAGPNAPNVVHGERVGSLGQTNEEWLGLILFDLAYLWRHDVEPDVDERGPAVVTMEKSWWLDPAEGTGPVMTGRTYLTVHADGRLVIAYDIDVPTVRGGTLVSYVALDINRFSNVTFSDGVQFTLPSDATPTGPGYLNLGGTERLETGYMCAWENSPENRQAVGFAAKRTGANLLLPRITQNSFVRGEPNAPAHSIRLQYDMARTTVTAGGYYGTFQLTIDESRSCTRAAALAEAFRSPPPLSFSVGNLDRDVTADTDGDGYNDVTGAYSVEAPSSALAFRALEAAPSMTLRVAAATWGAVAVTIDGTPLVPGTDFVAQPSAVASGGWIVIAREVPADVLVEIAW